MTTVKPPRRNLPPEAENWGRYVDTEMNQLRSDLNNSLTNIDAGFAANASSMAALSIQIANQVAPSMQQATRTTFGVTGSFANILSVNLNRPSWASQCLLFVTGFCTARIGSGGDPIMSYVRVVAAGNSGPTVVALPHASNAAGTTTNASATTTWSTRVTDMINTGQDFVTASVQMFADYPSMYPSSAGSNASINAIALWLR